MSSPAVGWGEQGGAEEANKSGEAGAESRRAGRGLTRSACCGLRRAGAGKRERGRGEQGRGTHAISMLRRAGAGQRRRAGAGKRERGRGEQGRGRLTRSACVSPCSNGVPTRIMTATRIAFSSQ
jgi:hypothetical protein